MDKIKIYAIVSLILLVTGYGLGRYVQPPQEVIKTEIQEREVVRKDIVTIVKEITKPDGTKETVTTTTDNTVERKDTKTEHLETKIVEKQWFIAAGVARESLVSENIYQLSVNRRILGPIYAGLSANTEKQFGLNVGMEF